MFRSTSAMEESITASLDTFRTLASLFTVLSFLGGEERWMRLGSLSTLT